MEDPLLGKQIRECEALLEQRKLLEAKAVLALRMIHPCTQQEDRPSLVEKTMHLREDIGRLENVDQRQKPPKTSRRKTKQT